MAEKLPTREAFRAKLQEYLSKKKTAALSDIFPPEKYAKIIDEVKAAAAKTVKLLTTTDRRRLARYAVLTIGGVEKLIGPMEPVTTR